MATEIVFDNKEINKWLTSMKINAKAVKEKTRKYAAVLSSIIFSDVVEHFEKEEGSSGKWKEWSKSYQDSIAGIVAFRTINNRVVPFSGEGFNPPRKDGNILQDTGRLRNSFNPASYRISGNGITWFNNAKTKSGFPYAFAHNEGGPKLPKRDFMWLSDKAMDKVEDQTIKFIMDEG